MLILHFLLSVGLFLMIGGGSVAAQDRRSPVDFGEIEQATDPVYN